MQIQKQEVKDKIINSAIDDMLEFGYEKSSMRKIAANAGTTVGNIYSYFKSKEDLYKTVVLPTVMQINGLILIKPSTNNKITVTSAAEVANQITGELLIDTRRFLILMYGGAGSPYENIKSVIQGQIKERIIADLIPQLHVGVENEILADTLSLTLLDGIINIVVKSKNDVILMNRLIRDFLLLVFGNISERL